MSEEEYIDAIRSSLQQPKVFLRRKSNEVAINAYNRIVLNLMELKMDIQYITNGYGSVHYMINYITKTDPGMTKILRETSDNIDINMPLKDELRSVGNVFINSNSMTAQEAVYHCLSLPLISSTRSSVYVNTVPINERVKMLETLKELQSLGNNSNEIFYPSIFINYANRRQKLEESCLA
ncbi:hypothetical protein QAD02_017599 [Eretmocerus hayati]|uniref:Uncharacterized protein n=1 Tax=Eretmocerus hayati TaxID=131215 RepID=A0ACC2PHB2_9HYME|nr:hypothetical protein QAD02_017599 [Eretmocerus hayati]